MKYEFRNIGLEIPSPTSNILTADSSQIKYKTDLELAFKIIKLQKEKIKEAESFVRSQAERESFVEKNKVAFIFSIRTGEVLQISKNFED